MIFPQKTAEQRRRELQKQLKSGRCLRFAGSFSPLVSRLIEEKGFDGVYVSGAVLSADRGLPDTGLITLKEAAERAENWIQPVSLPSVADADTGFGGEISCARSVFEMERAGLSGLHIEDQDFASAKRCGHLDNKKLISQEAMARKIQAACKARRDKNFLIIARTDARSVLGMKDAIQRAKAYVEAGADMIFPEALRSAKEFEAFRAEISAPLLANMTEFGKTGIIPHKEFDRMGYNILIYPVSALRLALQAVEKGLEALAQDRQEELLPRMQTRKRLYELLRYKDYEAFDREVFNFSLPESRRARGRR